jgi:hypothetical protein
MNHVGALKEWMDARTLSFDDVVETYEAEGPGEATLHWCNLMYGQHTVQSRAHPKKKMAKQEAAGLLQATLANMHVHGPATQVQAMLGDSVLKHVLLRHFSMQAGITPANLQNLVVNHSTNIFLNTMYYALTPQGLPEGLPPPTGNTNADASRFEAFIASLEDDSTMTTMARVLPLLGLA